MSTFFITLADFKVYKDITTSGDDAFITDTIDRAEAWFEDEIHMPLLATVDTVRTFSDEIDGHVYFDTLNFDTPLASITSIVNIASFGDAGVTVPLNELWLSNDKPYWSVKLRNSATAVTAWGEEITVTGKFALVDGAIDTGADWSDIRQALLRLTDYAYSNKDASVFEVTSIPGTGQITIPMGFPTDVLRLVSHYRVLTNV